MKRLNLYNMQKIKFIVILGSLFIISSCEKNCEKDKTWLNTDLDYKCVKDRGGNKYATIKIGDQTWMAENLRTNVYSNGDPIPNVTDGTLWGNLTTGAWAHNNNDTQYESPYGKIYNWYAVADPRNVCPSGWHVPTDAEWTVLTDYLGDESVAGGKMKSIDTQYWTSPNTSATNESGFSGLPGGDRVDSYGKFYDVGGYGFWWSSTEENNYDAWCRYLYYTNDNTHRPSRRKQDGFSVRCIQD